MNPSQRRFEEVEVFGVAGQNNGEKGVHIARARENCTGLSLRLWCTIKLSMPSDTLQGYKITIREL